MDPSTIVTTTPFISANCHNGRFRRTTAKSSQVVTVATPTMTGQKKQLKAR